MPTPFDTSFGATDLIEASQVSQFASPINDLESGSAYYAADAGSTDAYAVTMSPTPTVYAPGMLVHFKANTANTGAASLNVNSLGAKTIKKNASADLTTGDISAGQIVAVVYDGTNFQLVNSSAAVSPSTLDGLSDVVAASPATGAVLMFDGSDWRPALAVQGPDKAPASPATADDEFTGASLDTAGTRFSGATAWAWRNQGGATAALTAGHLVLTAPGNGSDSFRVVEQVLPSAPWTFQMKLASLGVSESNDFQAGLVLLNNSSGKAITFTKTWASGPALSVSRFTSVTSFSATNTETDIFGSRDFYQPLYLEIENDGTDLTMRYSDSGLDGTWKTFATEALSTFISSVDRIGIVANSTNSNPVATVVDWFRRVA